MPGSRRCQQRFFYIKRCIYDSLHQIRYCHWWDLWATPGPYLITGGDPGWSSNGGIFASDFDPYAYGATNQIGQNFIYSALHGLSSIALRYVWCTSTAYWSRRDVADRSWYVLYTR